MRKGAVRLGLGTRLSYDGELVEVVDMLSTSAGNEVVLRGLSGRRVWRRVAVRELLRSEDTRVLPVGQIDETDEEQGKSIGVILAELTDQERDEVLQRAEHIRELLTGYRSGHAELARPDEPRKQYHPRRAPGRPTVYQHAVLRTPTSVPAVHRVRGRGGSDLTGKVTAVFTNEMPYRLRRPTGKTSSRPTDTCALEWCALADALRGRNWQIFGQHPPCQQTSISAYFYTPVRAVFITALGALGACLIIYRGNSITENIVLNLAGLAAIVVAFVPTQPPTPQEKQCRQLMYQTPSRWPSQCITAAGHWSPLAPCYNFAVIVWVRGLPPEPESKRATTDLRDRCKTSGGTTSVSFV